MYLFTYPNTTSSSLQLQVSTKDESVSNGSAKINGVLLNSSKSTNNSTNNSGSKSTKKSGVAGKSQAPSVIDCCEASTMTDPNLLGPCQPGTAVKLQGAVLQESEKGKMLVNWFLLYQINGGVREKMDDRKSKNKNPRTFPTFFYISLN